MGARCAHCRLALRSTWHGFERCAAASDSKDEKLLVQCHFCETQYNVTIPASWPEWKRDLTRLSKTYKEDDFYTDKKARAVRLYTDYLVRRREARQAAREKLAEAMERLTPGFKPKPSAYASARREEQKPQTKRAKLRQALIDEYVRDVQGERRAMLKKYGRRFPELDALSSDLPCWHFYYSDYTKPDSEDDDYLKHLRAWATIEAVIWGEPLAHTVEEIAEHERALARLAAGIEERDRRRQEERDNQERERRERIEAVLARPAAPTLESPPEPSGVSQTMEEYLNRPDVQHWLMHGAYAGEPMPGRELTGSWSE
jgi:hypothetical protein